jgi:hypothetical protein
LKSQTQTDPKVDSRQILRLIQRQTGNCLRSRNAAIRFSFFNSSQVRDILVLLYCSQQIVGLDYVRSIFLCLHFDQYVDPLQCMLLLVSVVFEKLDPHGSHLSIFLDVNENNMENIAACLICDAYFSWGNAQET